MIVPYANYPLSKNYRMLWDLAQRYSIVCIVDMEHGKPCTARDITSTTHSPEWDPKLVQVGSRGIGHVWAESVDEFVAGCEACNLEWIVPYGNLDATTQDSLPNQEMKSNTHPGYPSYEQIQKFMLEAGFDIPDPDFESAFPHARYMKLSARIVDWTLAHQFKSPLP